MKSLLHRHTGHFLQWQFMTYIHKAFLVFSWIWSVSQMLHVGNTYISPMWSFFHVKVNNPVPWSVWVWFEVFPLRFPFKGNKLTCEVEKDVCLPDGKIYETGSYNPVNHHHYISLVFGGGVLVTHISLQWKMWKWAASCFLMLHVIYGCFLKWCYPQSPPQNDHF